MQTSIYCYWCCQTVCVTNPVGQCLYAANMVGRVPLMPLFLAGNSTLNIPHHYSKYKGSGFPIGCAHTAAVAGRCGSNMYKLNPCCHCYSLAATLAGGILAWAVRLLIRLSREVQLPWDLTTFLQTLQTFQISPNFSKLFVVITYA